jgi:hypothetical protein
MVERHLERLLKENVSNTHVSIGALGKKMEDMAELFH